MRKIRALSLIVLISFVLQGQELSEPDILSKCQQALLTRKVANGEFSEAVIEKAMKLPQGQLAAANQEKDIRKLFDQLAADKFEARESATNELIEKHNAPGYLKVLMNQTRDPEVLGRVKKILDVWKEKDPGQEFNLMLRMWSNCPTSLVKLKTFPEINEQAQINRKGQIIYDAIKDLSLEDFPADDRVNAVIYWSDEILNKALFNSFPFLKQINKEEWRNARLLEALKKLIENEENQFGGHEFVELLNNIPDDLDLKGWVPMLGSSSARKGAIACLLVKTGNKEALPAFVELLNQEWTSITSDNGRINGGGHSMYYSPFYRFEIIGMPAYRKFAPEILKGIEEKFSDNRSEIHEAYLNIVRYLADTEAGTEMLEKLSVNKCPQAAMAACLMLYERSGKDEILDRFLPVLGRASPLDVMNNHEGLVETMRTMIAKMLLSPEKTDYYRKHIRSMGELIIKKIHGADMEYAKMSLIDFFIWELRPFDLIELDGRKIVEMINICEKFDLYMYPVSAAGFIVDDAIKNGNLKELLEQLAVLARKPGAKLWVQALFADCAMSSGKISAAEPMKDTLAKLLSIKGDGEQRCPSQIIGLSWILYPEMVISSPQSFGDLNYFLLRGATLDYEKIANRIARDEKGATEQLFRFSYGLEGADLSKMEEWDNQVFMILAEMAWKSNPSENALRDKILEMLEKMEDLEKFWGEEDLLDNIPELARKFKIKIDADGNKSPSIQSLAMEMAFRRNEAGEFDRLEKGLKEKTRKAGNAGKEIFKRRMIMEFASGRISESTVQRLSAMDNDDLANVEAYKFISILYENGFAEKAREVRKLVLKPGTFEKWAYSECNLSWAWNEAIAGNLEEAVKLAETALYNASSKDECDYSVMLRRLLKENSDEFKRFLEVLAMKKDFSRRGDYSEALAKFAEKASDRDLKALSAFLAARTAMALNKDEGVVRQLWKTGADAGGLHSRYCRDALNSVAATEKKFIVSSSWYSRDEMPKEMTPFTHSIGISYNAEKPFLCVNSAEWIGPYGISVSIEMRQCFVDGNGWWNYIRNEGRAWVPGEWSVIIRYDGTGEYHQKTLVPYGFRK